MKTIGIIGAGTMGKGVAQCFAQAGYKVILIDITEEILEKAKQDIYNSLRLQILLKKSNHKDNLDEVLSRITYYTDYGKLCDVDFIVENVSENDRIKEEVYRMIDEICHDDCIFAVNTSCISITKIASFTKRPHAVIGIHFMNPVDMIEAVEVVRGFHTSEETLHRTNKILESIHKQSIVVNDLPGFVSNRISHLFMNEAAFVVQDQVASPKEVDEIFKKCYGHKMGPLETADLIGLDTVVDSLDILYRSYQDSKFRCCPLLKKMVDAGLYGKKAGRGFYTY